MNFWQGERKRTYSDEKGNELHVGKEGNVLHVGVEGNKLLAGGKEKDYQRSDRK